LLCCATNHFTVQSMQIRIERRVDMYDEIFITDMLFFGKHGVYQPEKDKGGRFSVDLHLFMDLTQAGRSDQLTDTLDYEKLYRHVQQIMEGPSKNLLEALADDIARSIFALDARIMEMVVTVRKLDPPFPGAFGALGSTIRRLRSSM